MSFSSFDTQGPLENLEMVLVSNSKIAVATVLTPKQMIQLNPFKISLRISYSSFL